MLEKKIKTDLNKYLKLGDKPKVSLTRLLLAAIKDKEISLRNNSNNNEDENILDDTEVIEIIRKMIKQRNLAIEAFNEAKRPDLAEKEKLESELLTIYLPKQFSESELKKVIEDIIKELKAKSIREMGLVMKYLKEKFGDKCDFQKASKFVKEKLSKGENLN